MNGQSNIDTKVVSRRQQAEARYNELLGVALDLFAEQGFDTTSVKDIAKRAGVAPGLLYHYFPSKEDLLNAVLEEHSFLPQLRELLRLAPEQPVEAVLLDVVSGFSAILERKEALFRIVVRETQTRPGVAAHLGEMIGEAVAALGAYLRARVAAGELRPHDEAVTARTLLNTVVMTHLTRSPDRPWAALVGQVLHGIQAGQGWNEKLGS